MESFREIWDNALLIIKDKVSETSYKMWIQVLKPIKFENDVAYFYAQSNFQKGLISSKFGPIIEAALFEVMGFDIRCEILSEEDVGSKTKNKYQDKEPEPDIIEQQPVATESGNLNSSLTFKNFVVGDENKFAHAAALAVANNPAGAYNPFFIYGRSGLGKTHLLCAIANEIKANNPDATIVMVKGEEFTYELIQAIREGEQNKFRNKYRFADVLLVDDVQFIGGKVSTEVEFFHTFETLFEAKKQIIVTSDRPPKEMVALEDRLRSRFESGLIADIQPPEYETRVAIIKNKAQALKLELTDDIINFIATKLKNNVRELEGAVNKIKAYKIIFLGQPPTLGIIQNIIQSIIKENINDDITPDMIIEHVAKFFNISKDDIYSEKRQSSISNARQIAMYLTRELTDSSLSIIGESFGGKNHTTVLHSIRKVEKQIETDAKFSQMIIEMKENIKKAF